IKHLLSHSSGIPDARGGMPRERKVFADESVALEYLDTLTRLHFAPGTAYEYINPTFVLLGRLVERISGKQFTEYVKEHIFHPAGMDKTCYFSPEAIIPDMAHGYEYADVEEMPEERTAGVSEGHKDWYEYDYGEETFFATRPDGGIYSSTHEFVLWEKALRASLQGKEGSILPSGYLQDAMSPHIKVSDSGWSGYQNRPDTWYGYGWFIEGKELIYHTGDNGGFKALVAREPSKDIMIAIFSCRADWDRYNLWKKIASAL
ncbi:MAG: serine hydrolase, partial [Bacteroidales bacterium]|nr:serine hydrolase [Bacteroidales bacterium]